MVRGISIQRGISYLEVVVSMAIITLTVMGLLLSLRVGIDENLKALKTTKVMIAVDSLVQKRAVLARGTYTIRDSQWIAVASSTYGQGNASSVYPSAYRSNHLYIDDLNNQAEKNAFYELSRDDISFHSTKNDQYGNTNSSYTSTFLLAPINETAITKNWTNQWTISLTNNP